MNEQNKSQFVETGPTNNRLAASLTQNEPIINCFYNRPFSPCPFTTSESKAMEQHYKKNHYRREVIGG